MGSNGRTQLAGSHAVRSDWIRAGLFFVFIVVFGAVTKDLRLTISAGFLGFFAVLLPHALRTRKEISSADEYFLSGHRLSEGPLASTLLSSNLSLGNFLIVVTLMGYFFGLAGLAVTLLAIVMNYIGARWLIPRIKSYIESEDNVGTIHQFIGLRHEANSSEKAARNLRRYCAWITVAGLLLAIVFELHIGATVFAYLTGIPQTVLFIFVVFIICVYAAIAGYAAVVFTDIIQASLNIIGAIVLLVLLVVVLDNPMANYADVFGGTPGITQGFGVPWEIWVSLPVLSLFWFVASLDHWQRQCASRSSDVSLRGSSLGIAGMALIGAIFVLFGIINRAGFGPMLDGLGVILPDNSGNPLLDFFVQGQSETVLSVVVLGVFGIALLFAALSTADTFLIACTQAIVGDVILTKGNIDANRWWERSETRQSPTVVMSQGVLVLLGGAIVVVWFVVTQYKLMIDPLNFFFVAYSVQFALVGSVVFGIGKKVRKSAHAGMVSVTAGWVAGLGLGVWGIISVAAEAEPFGVLTSAQVVSLSPVFCIIASFFGYAMCMPFVKALKSPQGHRGDARSRDRQQVS